MIPNQDTVDVTIPDQVSLAPIWTKCADEDGVCSFSGTRTVRYGIPGSYYMKVFTGSANCSNYTFNDPAVGIYKACDVAGNVTATNPEPAAVAQDVVGDTTLILSDISDQIDSQQSSYNGDLIWISNSGSSRSYVEYTVNVTSSGSYDVELTLASATANTGYQVSLDAVVLGSVAIPNTGGLSTYSAQTLEDVILPVGIHRFRIHKLVTDQVNLSNIKLIKN